MIEVKELSIGYGGLPVAECITLSLFPGQVMAIIGPNGCGKSTLLRTILGLQPRVKGEVLMDGVDADRLTPRQRAQKAAYLAQARPVPNITARRMVLHGRFPYLSYPRRYGQADYDAAERALDRADAAELADRSMEELSGGQRQRVYLAMALAQETPTILMDEPTTYLDVGHQLEVMAIAHRLAGEGRAVAMVLHDLCLALRWADRVAVLAEGRALFCGEPEEAYRSGILERVFGVKLTRFQSKTGWQYCIEGRR